MGMLPSQPLRAAKAGWLLPPTSATNQNQQNPQTPARTSPPSLLNNF
jgi:hypothetical protein